MIFTINHLQYSHPLNPHSLVPKSRKNAEAHLPMVQALQRHRFHVAIHLALHATFPCLPPKEAALVISTDVCRKFMEYL